MVAYKRKKFEVANEKSVQFSLKNEFILLTRNGTNIEHYWSTTVFSAQFNYYYYYLNEQKETNRNRMK